MTRFILLILSSPVPSLGTDDYNGLPNTSLYTSKIIFDSYDANGNILQYHNAYDINIDIPITFVWGYKNTFPVAKIIGASYDAVETKLGATLNTINNAYMTDDDLRNALLPLQDGTLQDILVTIYTYDPLYGKTSETDPNGKTTYYEYDEFGRLQFIKDHDGNILQQTEYNYGE